MFQLGPFETADQLLNAALDHVRRVGFLVSIDDEGIAIENVIDVRERFGVGRNHFSKILAAPDCPPFYAERGPTGGRIVRLKVNARLARYIAARVTATANYRP